MLYLLLDILFYCLTPFKTCFIIINFSKKRNIIETIIITLIILFLTKKYLYYSIIITILIILNKYARKIIWHNKLVGLTINFLIFTNIYLDINYLLTYLVFVLINFLGPYNLLGD